MNSERSTRETFSQNPHRTMATEKSSGGGFDRANWAMASILAGHIDDEKDRYRRLKQKREKPVLTEHGLHPYRRPRFAQAAPPDQSLFCLASRLNPLLVASERVPGAFWPFSSMNTSSNTCPRCSHPRF